MILNKIDDPRDNLEKAHRLELVKFAQAQGVTEITEHMPAILIRRTLRARGLTNIRIPPRPLGTTNASPSGPNGEQKVVEVDAADDLARQFARSAAPPKKNARPPRLVERPKSEINKLRDICKERGIKMARRDGKEDLKRKIAEHGPNAAASG